MKHYISLIIFIFPLITFANCIEFNGRFKCSSDQGITTRLYSTTLTNGTYIYEFADENVRSLIFFANGVERPFELEEQGLKIIGVITTQCSPVSLNSYFIGKVEGDSGKVEIKMSTSRDGEKIKNSLEIFYNGLQITKVNENCVSF